MKRNTLFSSPLSIRSYTTNTSSSSQDNIQPKYPANQLTHTDSKTHQLSMVNVSNKPFTSRYAKARCQVIFKSESAFKMVIENTLKKGDVLSVSKIAGIMAGKQTGQLIPLCHPLMLDHIDVECEIIDERQGHHHDYHDYHDNNKDKNEDKNEEKNKKEDDISNESNGKMKNKSMRIQITTTTRCYGPTGVEMEALVAAGMAGMCVIDMVKGMDRNVTIEGLRVIEKGGGRSGDWKSSI